MLTLLALLPASHGALKLSYFDARGAAETTRLLLAIAGAKYEDKRFSIGPGMAAPEFKEAKESGRLVANLGRAPIMSIEGQGEIGQSKAMERFVARQYGMFGATEFEACKIDAIAEHCRDINDAKRTKGFSRFSQKSDEDKAAARTEWFETDLPSWLERLEACVMSYSGADGCAVGSALSYADVCLWALLRECPEDEAAETAKAANACTKLNAIADAVAAHPNVEAWLKSRPATAF
jgi:glutathione S-transferase